MFTNVITWILSFINNMFTGMENIELRISDGLVDVLTNYWACACYWFPVQDLYPLAIGVIALLSFKVIVSVIKSIWELLPIL